MSVFITNGLLDVCDPLMARHECFDTLDQAFERPLVCINGGQGTGKTILVSSYLKDRALPTIWFTLGLIDHHDYAHFYKLLVEGLVSLGYKAEIENELTLFETISKIDKRLIFVIDCAKIQQPEPNLIEFLMKLIQYRSSKLTFVLISRHRLKLPYAKLKAQKKIYEWKTSGLSFTPDEIATLFMLEGIVLKTEEIQEITFQTGGWVLGVSYLANVWKESTQQERKQFPKLLDNLLLELFSDENDLVSSHLLEVFTYLSVLHELKTEVVNAYLIEGESDRIWEELGTDQFFLQRQDDFSYRILPVVRNFLYQRLIYNSGIKNVREHHLKVAKIYEEQFQYYNAFAHCLAGGWYEEAARLMQFMMNFYTPERFLLLMDGSLETICPSISMSTYSMFLFRCVPMSILKSYVPKLQQSLEHLEDDGATQSLLNLQHRLGLILFYSGEVLLAKELFERSLAISEKLGNEEYIIVNLSLLAQCCRFLNELEKGVEAASKALAKIELYGAYPAKTHTTWVLCELLLEQRDLVTAKPIIDEFMRWGEDSYEDSTAWMYTIFVKAKYARLIGNLDEALEWAEKGFTAASGHSLAPDLGWASLEMGCIYKELNEIEKAIEWFTKSAKHFQHYRYFYKLADHHLSEITKENIHVIGNDSTMSSTMNFKKSISTSTTQILSNAPNNKLVIQMLGPLKMTRNGLDISISRKSSLMLLLCLAVNYGKKLPKERILEDLFPNGDYLAQNNRFYVSLSTLRKALEPDLKSGRESTLIIQNGELYSLDHTNCIIDLAEFELLMNHNEEKAGDRIANLLKAEKLYQGNLLEAYPYENFLNPVRERAQRLYNELLLELARFYWKTNNPQNGINYFDRLLDWDEYAETTYWEYIQTLVENQFLKNAQNIAEKMIRRLEKELGVPVTHRLKIKFPGLI